MQSTRLRRIIDKWPGKRFFGIYRFMPLFFGLGAALEFSMINWDVGERVNFYRTYKRRQVQELADREIFLRGQSDASWSKLAQVP